MLDVWTITLADTEQFGTLANHYAATWESEGRKIYCVGDPVAGTVKAILTIKDGEPVVIDADYDSEYDSPLVADWQ